MKRGRGLGTGYSGLHETIHEGVWGNSKLKLWSKVVHALHDRMYARSIRCCYFCLLGFSV